MKLRREMEVLDVTVSLDQDVVLPKIISADQKIETEISATVYILQLSGTVKFTVSSLGLL